MRNRKLSLTLFFLITILSLSLLSLLAYAETVKLNAYVNDYATVIDAQHQFAIEEIAKHLRNESVAEYAVVTIDSLDGRDIEGYAFELANGKLGDKEKNNGLLLLVAVKDKQYRFEVGRGLEAELNDAKIGRIGRQYLVPFFREYDYGGGILEASRAIESLLLANTSSSYYATFAEEEQQIAGFSKSNYFSIASMFIVFAFVFFLVNLGARRKETENYFQAALLAGLLFGGRGGRGGFGGMGGFGGFGGGSFGGGGAGGGW